MSVITESDNITELRKSNLRLILAGHPNDCMTCEKTGKCKLKDYAYQFDAPVNNKGSLCVKGRFGYEHIHHKDRLTAPLIRKNGKLVESSWDEAIGIIATKFKEIHE